MKKSLQLILLIVILGLAIGTYLFLRNQSSRTLEKAALDKSDTVERIYIVKCDPELINRIHLEHKEGNIVFTKKDEQWAVVRSKPVKLNPALTSGLASSLATLSATEIIAENPGDLADYGLNAPRATITLSLSDGSSKVLYLGADTPTRYGSYLMCKDDPRVYTISQFYASQFTQTLADFLDQSLPAFDSQYFERFILTHKGGPTIEVVNNTEQTEAESQYGLSIWSLVRPYRDPKSIRGDKFKEVLDALDAIRSVDQFVGETDSLQKYGLDSPVYELTAKDKYTVLQLQIGNKTEDGMYYYCKTPDSPSVFLIGESKLSFLATAPFDFLDRFILLVNIDEVDRIEIFADNGQKYEITMTRKLVKKATKEYERDKIDVVYRVNGKKVPENQFKTFYQRLVGLMVEAEVHPNPPAAKPAVKTVYYLNQGEKRVMAADYVPYDQDFYTVFKDGYSEFLISREQVRLMLSDLVDLSQGKLKVPPK